MSFMSICLRWLNSFKKLLCLSCFFFFCFGWFEELYLEWLMYGLGFSDYWEVLLDLTDCCAEPLEPFLFVNWFCAFIGSDWFLKFLLLSIEPSWFSLVVSGLEIESESRWLLPDSSIYMRLFYCFRRLKLFLGVIFFPLSSDSLVPKRRDPTS